MITYIVFCVVAVLFYLNNVQISEKVSQKKDVRINKMIGGILLVFGLALFYVSLILLLGV